MPFDVKTLELPEQTVTSARRKVEASELRTFVSQTIAELRQQLLRTGVPESGEPFAIIHEKVDAQRPGEVEVCVPCRATDADDIVLERRMVPGALAAYVEVDEADAEFPRIVAAYDAVADFILRQGRLLGDAPRELYGESGTRIAWPMGGEAKGPHATLGQ
jgi:effector-binding domain-containing protein